jgi:prepilin peptidase CpaA
LVPTITFVVALVAVLIAAVTDLWKFKVYNLLTVPLLVAGLTCHGIVGGWTGFLNSLLGAGFGFGILFVFYLMGGMGAGDVKLIAGVGAWLGMPLTLYVFITSSLAAGCYALVLIVVYGTAREAMINLQIIWLRLALAGRHFGAEDAVETEVHRAGRRRRIIPFAAMMALGLLALAAWSWLGQTAW